LVQFTKSNIGRSGNAPADEPNAEEDKENRSSSIVTNEEAEIVFIRKFCSVSNFLEGVRSLDSTLDAIESFTNEVSQLKAGKDAGAGEA